ncbi:unnamed protein product [Lepeophtheirus salmonis]|uniref:(salmon louse) hypothetical protein n=1 Tax=Lepeophtheirus salmonis TaxID=72036 RepID=A0A7R8H5D9_LEPSM|nr:unnamed protein product [Lepeophtheirus salmonis]CAF2876959.1 unnamed protein product [Lepeophtheirus salmonis]
MESKSCHKIRRNPLAVGQPLPSLDIADSSPVHTSGGCDRQESVVTLAVLTEKSSCCRAAITRNPLAVGQPLPSSDIADSSPVHTSGGCDRQESVVTLAVLTEKSSCCRAAITRNPLAVGQPLPSLDIADSSPVHTSGGCDRQESVVTLARNPLAVGQPLPSLDIADSSPVHTSGGCDRQESVVTLARNPLAVGQPLPSSDIADSSPVHTSGGCDRQESVVTLAVLTEKSSCCRAAITVFRYCRQFSCSHQRRM